MKEDISKFYSLLAKFSDGTISKQEGLELKLMEDVESIQDFDFNTFSTLNAEVDHLATYEEFNIVDAWDNIDSKLPINSRNMIYKRIGAIAAIMLALVFALFTFFTSPNNSSNLYSSTSNSQYLILNDLTEVELGQHSKLKLTDYRIVELEGDAFFHVTRNEKRGFEINTKLAKLKVLGTSFKIDQSEASMTIQMREGKVEIYSTNGSNQVIQIEGEEFAIITTSGIEVGNGSGENLLDDFIFNNASIKTILQDINLGFNGLVDSDFQYIDQDCRLTANFNNLSLMEILEELDLLFDMDYNTQNGRVQITALTCH